MFTTITIKLLALLQLLLLPNSIIVIIVIATVTSYHPYQHCFCSFMVVYPRDHIAL